MAVDDRHKWNDRWAAARIGEDHRSKLVDLLQPWLPGEGRVLDVAGGGSTDSLAFARLGLSVTVCDVSDVGLIQARQRALAEDLAISTIEVDLESEPLPTGPWDVITVANFLQYDLFDSMVAALAPGGLLGVMIATVANLDRHDRPSRPFLVDPGRLPSLVADLEILHHSEEWRESGRHEAHLVARRRP